MSIKAVDLQVVIPKSSEVSKINADGQQKMAVAQQQQESQTQQRVENNMKQVHRQDNINEIKIRDKQEKNRDGKNRGGEGKKESEQGGKQQARPDTRSKKDLGERKSTIDIRL